MAGKSTKAAQKTDEAKKSDRTISVNRRAHFDYEIVQQVEAGMALTGTEIKSVRLGKVNLREAYARVERGEVWVHNMHIAQYDQGNRNNHEPLRPRKLLLHHEEIEELAERTAQKGFTLIPLRLYIKKGRAKLEVGVGRGKKQYDKRDSIAEREATREIDRAVRQAREVYAR
jgi:SsrA-binding protein